MPKQTTRISPLFLASASFAAILALPGCMSEAEQTAQAEQEKQQQEIAIAVLTKYNHQKEQEKARKDLWEKTNAALSEISFPSEDTPYKGGILSNQFLGVLNKADMPDNSLIIGIDEKAEAHLYTDMNRLYKTVELGCPNYGTLREVADPEKKKVILENYIQTLKEIIQYKNKMIANGAAKILRRQPDGGVSQSEDATTPPPDGLYGLTVKADVLRTTAETSHVKNNCHFEEDIGENGLLLFPHQIPMAVGRPENITSHVYAYSYNTEITLNEATRIAEKTLPIYENILAEEFPRPSQAL